MCKIIISSNRQNVISNQILHNIPVYKDNSRFDPTRPGAHPEPTRNPPGADPEPTRSRPGAQPESTQSAPGTDPEP
jgi:hypothetical protein